MDNIQIIKFIVDLPPITKKNHQRILKAGNGKRFVAPSEQYKEYEETALWYIPRNIPTINYPVNIKCLFYLPTKRKVDLTNLLESIDDIMVKGGLLEDDNYNIIASHDGSRVCYDKNKPRTEIYITKFNEMDG